MRTAIACSARSMTPRRPAGRDAARLALPAALRGPQLAALVAVQDRHERVPGRAPEAAEARAPGRLRGRLSRRQAARRARRGVGLDRAVPGRAARGRLCLAGRTLRAARE